MVSQESAPSKRRAGGGGGGVERGRLKHRLLRFRALLSLTSEPVEVPLHLTSDTKTKNKPAVLDYFFVRIHRVFVVAPSRKENKSAKVTSIFCPPKPSKVSVNTTTVGFKYDALALPLSECRGLSARNPWSSLDKINSSRGSKSHAPCTVVSSAGDVEFQ